MIFIPTKLPGVFVVEIEKREDARGFFARVWCGRELAEAGLTPRLAQANIAYNRRRGTLRGMHYQAPPHAEAKLVRCTRGAIFDVALDLRPDSPTCMQWVGVELTARNYRMLYVPEGCAHGYLTLADDTEVAYHVSTAYAPSHERGVRYDDPAFGIQWPFAPVVVSEKDRAWPDFVPRYPAERR